MKCLNVWKKVSKKNKQNICGRKKHTVKFITFFFLRFTSLPSSMLLQGSILDIKIRLSGTKIESGRRVGGSSVRFLRKLKTSSCFPIDAAIALGFLTSHIPVD